MILKRNRIFCQNKNSEKQCCKPSFKPKYQDCSINAERFEQVQDFATEKKSKTSCSKFENIDTETARRMLDFMVVQPMLSANAKNQRLYLFICSQ